jgi:hypothetical protein
MRKKSSFHLLFLLSLLVLSCNKKNKTVVVKPKVKKETQTIAVKKDSIHNLTSIIRPNQKLTLGKMMTDEFEFVSYNDNGDYFLIRVKKNKEEISLIYDWDKTKKYEFNRGDVINIDWKIDSMWVAGDGESLHFEEWAKQAVKVKDGPVSLFKKKYKKPLRFNYLEKYTDDFFDEIYLLVEYYLANSNQELVITNLNDPNLDLEYSIEERAEGGKEYIVIGISNSFEGHSSIIQWLYIEQGEKTTLYEYDLANEQLIEFK